MLPALEHEAVRRGWMSISEVTDAVVIAGMAPGPVGTNSAVYIGYQTAGLAGAAVSAAGITLPSLLLLAAVVILFKKTQNHRRLQSMIYGLRPAVAVLILYGAYRFIGIDRLASISVLHLLPAFILFAASFYALHYNKLHPALIILFSALIGIAIWS